MMVANRKPEVVELVKLNWKEAVGVELVPVVEA